MTEHSLSQRNPSFRDAVEAVGTADHLAVLVGAGVSIDVGLPSWTGLLRTILEQGLLAENNRDDTLFDTTSSDWYETEAQRILEASDAVSAATVARLLLGESGLTDQLRSALYGHQKYGVVAGRIAESIARLLRMMPLDTIVATTNYDDLLEYAIADTFGWERKQVCSIGPGSDHHTEKGTFSVQHLHGMLGKDRHELHPLVLDEKGYAGSQEAQKALDELLGDPNRTVLIIGSSMADPNLVSALHRGRENGTIQPASHQPTDRIYGMFVDAGATSSGMARLQRSRMEELGVRPVHLLSYLQISQVLNEMVLRKIAKDAYWEQDSVWRYGNRFETWREGIVSRYLPTGDTREFKKAQKKLNRELRDLLRDLRSQEDGLLRGGLDAERFVLELWVRSPGSSGLGTVELWASSAQLIRQPWLIAEQSRPLEPGTRVPAIEVLMHGNQQVKDYSANPDSKWSATVAIPIELREAPERRITVGALVLRSNLPMKSNDGQNSLLADLSSSADTRMNSLHEKLREKGEELLTPTETLALQAPPG